MMNNLRKDSKIGKLCLYYASKNMQKSLISMFFLILYAHLNDSKW